MFWWMNNNTMYLYKELFSKMLEMFSSINQSKKPVS